MLGPIAEGLASVLDIIFPLGIYLITAAVLCSWVNADPHNQIVQLIYRSSEFIIRPFRRFTSRLPGRLDWAPFIAILALIFLKSVVVGYLRKIAVSGAY